MFVDIRHLELLKFKGCKECTECCKKPLAPLILEDFKIIYNYFPILIAKLDYLRPVMLLSNEISCPYLNNGKCTIYENRPPACKIYPYSPWYDKILLDLSCSGVGCEGEYLPLNKKEFYNSSFYEERFENIKEKLNKTKKWLSKKDLIKIGSIKNIEIYKTDSINDEYDRMHQNSLEFLKNYQKSPKYSI